MPFERGFSYGLFLKISYCFESVNIILLTWEKDG